MDLLTNESNATETNSDEIVEGNDALKEKQKEKNHMSLSTVTHIKDIKAMSEVFGRNICCTRWWFTPTASCSTTANIHGTYHKKGKYQAFKGVLWEDVFHLYQSKDIARQSSNSESVDILNRVLKGKHISTDWKNGSLERCWHFAHKIILIYILPFT